MDQRRQRIGIVDVGADVGVENDGRRGLTESRTGETQGSKEAKLQRASFPRIDVPRV